MATIFRANGSDEQMTVEVLQQLNMVQAAVGGYIESVPAKGGILFVNEDGRMMCLPFNEKATVIAGQSIVGDAVFVPAEEMGFL
jgi:hypothetical protein